MSSNSPVLPGAEDDPVASSGEVVVDPAQVLLPMAKPVLATVTIMTALSSWTALVGPLIFLNDERLSTLSLGLQQYQSQHFTAYNLLLAASTLFVLPIAIIFVAGQRYFTAGATQGAVK